MEKLRKVRICLEDGSMLKAPEVMDIGQHYYMLNGKEIKTIHKKDVMDIEYGSKIQENDSSEYVRRDDGSCVSGKCN